MSWILASLSCCPRRSRAGSVLRRNTHGGRSPALPIIELKSVVAPANRFTYVDLDAAFDSSSLQGSDVAVDARVVLREESHPLMRALGLFDPAYCFICGKGML